jgi:hypothetical protein
MCQEKCTDRILNQVITKDTLIQRVPVSFGTNLTMDQVRDERYCGSRTICSKPRCKQAFAWCLLFEPNLKEGYENKKS